MNASGVFSSVDTFISAQFSKDDAALTSVEKSLSVAGISNISVSSSQGKLLHVLARMCQAKRILEIGTLGGYSSIWMARALPRTGKLLTIENSPEHARIAASNIDRARLSSKVEIRIGDADKVLRSLERSGVPLFDMVFIDADKVSYNKYLSHALKLTHAGSIIIADNVIRKGKVLDADSKDVNVIAVRRYLQTLAQSKKLSTAIVQTITPKGHDGLAISVVL